MTAPNDPTAWPEGGSPFHAGEQAMQEAAHVRESAERVGRAIIRDFMPEQHRELFEKLPYALLATLDREGWPWASVLAAEPGFITAQDARSLRVEIAALPGDPLSARLELGTRVGLLGIELHTRRRNRANGRVVARDADTFTLHVEQSFGNCPKHITPRVPAHARRSEQASVGCQAEQATLSGRALALIAGADTFFIASAAHDVSARDPRQGLDVSHRGGHSGFVSVEQGSGGSVLTFLDYRGNNAFNTLGNVLQNPRVGITFVDFVTGDVLMLVGRAEIVHELSAEQRSFGGERLVRVALDHGHLLSRALPLALVAV